MGNCHKRNDIFDSMLTCCEELLAQLMLGPVWTASSSDIDEARGLLDTREIAKLCKYDVRGEGSCFGYLRHRVTRRAQLHLESCISHPHDPRTCIYLSTYPTTTHHLNFQSRFTKL